MTLTARRHARKARRAARKEQRRVMNDYYAQADLLLPGRLLDHEDAEWTPEAMARLVALINEDTEQEWAL